MTAIPKNANSAPRGTAATHAATRTRVRRRAMLASPASTTTPAPIAVPSGTRATSQAALRSSEDPDPCRHDELIACSEELIRFDPGADQHCKAEDQPSQDKHVIIPDAHLDSDGPLDSRPRASCRVERSRARPFLEVSQASNT